MLCTFNAEKREFSSIITLGKNVCGHPTIVHGGLTAAIVDETFGGLNYMMKKRGMLDPGPAFTVHMVMDWKKVCSLMCTSGCNAQHSCDVTLPWPVRVSQLLTTVAVQPVPANSLIICRAFSNSQHTAKAWAVLC